MPVILATQKAKAGELLEPGRWRLQWAKTAPLHSSVGNRAKLHLSQSVNKCMDSLARYFHTLLHRRWIILDFCLFPHSFVNRMHCHLWIQFSILFSLLPPFFLCRQRMSQLHSQRRTVLKEKLVLRPIRITSELVLTGLSSFSSFS